MIDAIDIPDQIEVIDSLTSDETGDALSAKQGKVLKGLIDNLSIQSSTGHVHANMDLLNSLTQNDLDLWNGY